MSFVITLYVREGIVMASDSRLTMHATRREGDNQIVQLAVGLSDSGNKVFLTPGKVGIAIFGAADVQGVPISGYVESFMCEQLGEGSCGVDQVPQELVDHFRQLPGPPDTGFLVAGYKTVERVSEQQIWEVSVGSGKIARVNHGGLPGASWRGETDVLTRLIQPVAVQEAGEWKPLPHHPIQWGFFTLQDAIDYAVYAVQVTIDTMRFHPRPKTVGGPIDVLIIKPDEAFWVQRKTLRA